MKNFFKNSALLLASVALSLIVLEVGLRAVQGLPLLPTENLVAKRVSLLRTQSANDYDPDVGWVLKANLSGGGGSRTFTTGALGLRMNAPEIRAPMKGAILAVGDSFTAGSEVGDRFSWPAQLEQMLGQPVLNAATGGWGSDQIVLRAEKLIPVLAPNTIIVSFLVDDIQRAGYRVYGGANKPYFFARDGKLVHMNHPVPRYSGSVAEVGIRRSFLGHSVLANILMERFGDWSWWLHGQSYVTVDNDIAEVSCLLLRRLKARADKEKFRLIYLVQYGGSHIAQWDKEPDFALRVTECAKQDGIEVVNSWGPLKAVFTEQGVDALKKLYTMHDQGRVYGHMSAAGNEFIARLLAEQIRQ